MTNDQATLDSDLPHYAATPTALAIAPSLYAIREHAHSFLHVQSVTLIQVAADKWKIAFTHSGVEVPGLRIMCYGHRFVLEKKRYVA